MTRARAASVSLPFTIHRQPDDVTCGPTCLQAVYAYHGHDVPVQDLVRSVPKLDAGGTLGVLLATDALARGFRVKVVTWNLRIFDPTWFRDPRPPLVAKLRARAEAKPDRPKLQLAASAYADFVERGGKVEFRDLEPALLRNALRRRIPILTGLSATFLYREERQREDDDVPDDLRGDPVGHFVVLTGYDARKREVHVSDPMHPNALSTTHTYRVGIERLVGAIYLGVLTYDANLILIEPAG